MIYVLVNLITQYNNYLIFNLFLCSLGDIQYDLEEAAHVRAKLVKMYESVDIIR